MSASRPPGPTFPRFRVVAGLIAAALLLLPAALAQPADPEKTPRLSKTPYSSG